MGVEQSAFPALEICLGLALCREGQLYVPWDFSGQRGEGPATSMKVIQVNLAAFDKIKDSGSSPLTHLLKHNSVFLIPRGQTCLQFSSAEAFHKGKKREA